MKLKEQIEQLYSKSTHEERMMFNSFISARSDYFIIFSIMMFVCLIISFILNIIWVYFYYINKLNFIVIFMLDIIFLIVGFIFCLISLREKEETYIKLLKYKK